jgi:hypothetical protein
VVSVGLGAGSAVVSAAGGAGYCALVSGATGATAVSLGVGTIAVSLGCAVTPAVSVVTAVVSPRSGAAPTSSSDRLWQAARVATAAKIQRVFMSVCSPKAAIALPAQGLAATCHKPRAYFRWSFAAPTYQGLEQLTRS